jgi:hypothetical protein
MLSFLEIQKGVLKRLNFYRFRIFWQGGGEKRKYRLTKCIRYIRNEGKDWILAGAKNLAELVG